MFLLRNCAPPMHAPSVYVYPRWKITQNPKRARPQECRTQVSGCSLSPSSPKRPHSRTPSRKAGKSNCPSGERWGKPASRQPPVPPELHPISLLHCRETWGLEAHHPTVPSEALAAHLGPGVLGGRRGGVSGDVRQGLGLWEAGIYSEDAHLAFVSLPGSEPLKAS